MNISERKIILVILITILFTLSGCLFLPGNSNNDTENDTLDLDQPNSTENNTSLDLLPNNSENSSKYMKSADQNIITGPELIGLNFTDSVAHISTQNAINEFDPNTFRSNVVLNNKENLSITSEFITGFEFRTSIQNREFKKIVLAVYMLNNTSNNVFDDDISNERLSNNVEGSQKLTLPGLKIYAVHNKNMLVYVADQIDDSLVSEETIYDILIRQVKIAE